jgi:predicted dehydrogenase
MSMTAPAPSPRRPRVGFLGVGWIGRHRMEAMLATGLVEAVAFADPAEDMAEEVRRLVPDIGRAPHLEGLLDHELDAIVIATPSAAHARETLSALEAGLSVFCQKPLGRTEAEVTAVVEAARAADRLLAVDLSYRHAEGVRRIRDLARSGALGRIYAADLVFHNAYGPDKPWFYDPRLSGGGCMIDLGVHLVDLALSIFDEPVAEVAPRLFRKGSPVEPGAEAAEDFAVATVTFRSGAVTRLACSWGLPAGRDAIISASFYGTDGGAEIRNVDGSFYDFVAERFDGVTRQSLAQPPDPWNLRAAQDFARRLAEGARFDPRIAEQVEVARIIDRVYGRDGPRRGDFKACA